MTGEGGRNKSEAKRTGGEETFKRAGKVKTSERIEEKTTSKAY